MTLSRLPLSYCTNVHPGRSVAEVEAGLDRHTVAVKERLGRPLAAGLWLARPVVAELAAARDGARRFADRLAAHGLTCHTLNAFPYGDFHSDRVKEAVYLPDWTTPERLAYTVGCAEVLAVLLPDGVEGSISTVPLGFKGFDHTVDFADVCAARLVECARALARIRAETGKVIRLAIEPEPLCVLETTPEAVAFFERLWPAADASGAGEVVHEHVGLCYDVCHQAVEFEDVGGSIRELDRAGVRINKVHLSCALRLPNPGADREGRAALARFAEPRYLHQTFGRFADGRVGRHTDLTAELATTPPPEFAAADEWRVHFHVPLDAETVGPLGTTRFALAEALGAVADLKYAPHLEVETYTWDVLPDGGSVELADGLARELRAADGLIATARVVS